MRSHAFLALLLLATVTAGGNDKTQPADDPEAVYARALEKRATDILAVLDLDDPAKADRVRDILINQYRGLRAIHDPRDEQIKSTPKEDTAAIERIRAESDEKLAALRDEFLSKLSAELTPEQITAVKDKMTYGKVQVTFNAYASYLPQMTEEERSQVMDWLVQAREAAINGGSAEEKSKIFDQYKGRINNYLAKRGYDLKKAEREFFDRQKAARAATTQPGR